LVKIVFFSFKLQGVKRAKNHKNMLKKTLHI
jgi:hypothetical protein